MLTRDCFSLSSCLRAKYGGLNGSDMSWKIDSHFFPRRFPISDPTEFRFGIAIEKNEYIINKNEREGREKIEKELMKEQTREERIISAKRKQGNFRLQH